MVETDKPQITT